MPRFILIDNASGYIYGDTADYMPSRQGQELTPAEAARVLDQENIGEHDREYEELDGQHTRNGVDGYLVYRADVNGSEAVAVVTDGQDQEVIEAVERDCEFVCFVECRPAA